MRLEKDRSEHGFSLVELLVVMIVIGILAAVAVPVLLSQRAKARDSATKADIGTVGKEVASYYVDGDDASVLSGTISGTTFTLTATGYSGTVRLSPGTTYLSPATNAITYQTGPGCTRATGWMVTLSNPDGNTRTYYYSAQKGLRTTAVNLSAACG